MTTDSETKRHQEVIQDGNRKVTTTTTTITARTSSKSSSSSSSVSRWSKKDMIKGSLAILALTAALSANFVKNLVTDGGLLLGPIMPLNTEGCVPVQGLKGCEDIHMHHGSGLAFTACGDPETRKRWFPPMARRNASTEYPLEDQFVIYHVASGKYEVTEIVGLPSGTDRVFHGLDIFERSPTELTIFLINHRRTGSVVEVLEYTVGEKVAHYKETIQNDLIRTPNDILAVGPRSFYVSNDHKYFEGQMRGVEEHLRRPWCNVIYSSPEETFEAYHGIVSANGMTSTPDKKTIYVSGTHGGGLHILKPREDKTLEQVDYIKLDFYNDNPSYDIATGSVFMTGHVTPLKMLKGVHTLDSQVVAPSKVIKISKNILAESDTHAPSHVYETVIQDDGHLISTGTTAVLDRKSGVMIIGTVFGDNGLIRCPIPEGF